MPYFSDGSLESYCLPDISFQNKQLSEALYFQDATFYGKAYFVGARML
jgi:hypothetical protein